MLWWSIFAIISALTVFFIIPFVIETRLDNKDVNKDKEDTDA